MIKSLKSPFVPSVIFSLVLVAFGIWLISKGNDLKKKNQDNMDSKEGRKEIATGIFALILGVYVMTVIVLTKRKEKS